MGRICNPYRAGDGWLSLKNLLRPGRLWAKVRWGQVRGWPWLSRAIPIPKGICWQQEAEQWGSQWRRDGVVVIPGRFAEAARAIALRYGLDPKAAPVSNEYQYPLDGEVWVRDIDQLVLDLWANETFLQAAALYFGCQPYLRCSLQLSVCKPASSEGPSDLNVQWHYDTPNMIQMAVLLNNVTAQDTHMAITKGTHCQHRVSLGPWDKFYTEDYIRRHYSVVPCIGPIGTAYLFDSNAPHRLVPVAGSPRLMVKTSLTPGNDILTLRHPEANYRVRLGPDIDITALSPLQREALRYVVEQ